MGSVKNVVCFEPLATRADAFEPLYQNSSGAALRTRWQTFTGLAESDTT